jgi:electron transport complex protein RnfC
MLNRLAKLRDWEQAEAYHALDCIECGSCTYVCPAKLNITTNIRTAKRTILASRRK